MTPERKSDDISVDLTIAEAGGWQKVETSLNNLEQGIGLNQRIGDRFVLKSIQLQLQLKNIVPVNFSDINNVRQAASRQFSIALVLDRQSNGASAALTQQTIWQSPLSCNSYLLISNSRRFKILRKWNITLTPRALGIFVTDLDHYITWDMALVQLYKKCSIPIMQSGPAASETTIQSNNVSLWVCMEDQGGTGDNFTLSGIGRIRYMDN